MLISVFSLKRRRRRGRDEEKPSPNEGVEAKSSASSDEIRMLMRRERDERLKCWRSHPGTQRKKVITECDDKFETFWP